MKKTIIAFAGCILFALSCTKETESFNEEKIAEPDLETPVTGNRCAAHDVLEMQLQEDPTLAARMQAIERLTDDYIKNPGNYFMSERTGYYPGGF